MNQSEHQDFFFINQSIENILIDKTNEWFEHIERTKFSKKSTQISTKNINKRNNFDRV